MAFDSQETYIPLTFDDTESIYNCVSTLGGESIGFLLVKLDKFVISIPAK